MSTQVVVEGIAAAPGIAVGPVYPYARDTITVEQRVISAEELASEIARLDEAILRSERDLRKIVDLAREKLGQDSADIFEAHLLILRDQELYENVVEIIRQESCNADYAVNQVMNKHRRVLKASGSEYLQDRASDLLDIQDRIIRHLRRGKLLSTIEPNSIVVAANLTAADVVLFSRRGILGCAMEAGGTTSHVAIMARALGVPAVVSAHGIMQVAARGNIVAVDGLSGRIVVNPEPHIEHFYATRRRRYEALVRQNRSLVALPAETLDGVRMQLRANIEFKEEIKLLKENAAEGVGLFRTEIMFLMRGQFDVSEEEQHLTYRKLVAAVAPDITTFRVLDLGGDKLLPTGHREHNPFLGWRGIRILLDRPELLRPQLRAILRTAEVGPIRILLPMVTSVDEVRRFRITYREVLDELGMEDGGIQIGVMIEVPGAALQADIFAKEVDFLSIGTNDLTQYTLAIDRGNDLVTAMYDELHPAVLALIKMTLDAGLRQGVPVSLCGEMATNPHSIPILIGLGLREFSASPIFLPAMKRIIRSVRLPDVEALAAKALQLSDGHQVRELVDHWLDENLGEIAHLLRAGTIDDLEEKDGAAGVS
jgi:phosphoenolpyruvate-protein phosphotransferase (PTS system enzyme I)